MLWGFLPSQCPADTPESSHTSVQRHSRSAKYLCKPSKKNRFELKREGGKGREGKGREGKGREGKGREGKGREGKGREGNDTVVVKVVKKDARLVQGH